MSRAPIDANAAHAVSLPVLRHTSTRAVPPHVAMSLSQSTDRSGYECRRHAAQGGDAG